MPSGLAAPRRKSRYFYLGIAVGPGSDRWSERSSYLDDPDRSEQNPVLFQAPDNVLWLLWTAQFAGNRIPPFVRYRLSTMADEAEGAIDTLLDQLVPLFASQ